MKAAVSCILSSQHDNLITSTISFSSHLCLSRVPLNSPHPLAAHLRENVRENGCNARDVAADPIREAVDKTVAIHGAPADPARGLSCGMVTLHHMIPNAVQKPPPNHYYVMTQRVLPHVYCHTTHLCKEPLSPNRPSLVNSRVGSSIHAPPPIDRGGGTRSWYPAATGIGAVVVVVVVVAAAEAVPS